MFRKNSKGMSLIEVFITSFIFLVSTAAILVTLNSLRKPAVNNEQATEGALVGRNVLEDLRSKIDVRDIDTLSKLYVGDLSPGEHWVNGIGPGGSYNVLYTVQQDMSTGTLSVVANVFWPDAL